MQPPIEHFAADVSIPKIDTSRGDLLCFVYKRYKYVTLLFKPRTSGTPVHAFTIHQADAKKLVEALSQAVSSGADLTFVNRLYGGCEGFYHGGPPEKEELVEFMTPEERDRLVTAAAAKQRSTPVSQPNELLRKQWWKFW